MTCISVSKDITPSLSCTSPHLGKLIWMRLPHRLVIGGAFEGWKGTPKAPVSGSTSQICHRSAVTLPLLLGSKVTSDDCPFTTGYIRG
jgi:hypothetical protein